MTPTEIRAWREGLGLTESEAAEVLCLGNPHTIFREYQSGKRAPAPPTVELMRMVASVAAALVLMRIGRIDDAKGALQSLCTPALFRRIREQSPGPKVLFGEKA